MGSKLYNLRVAKGYTQEGISRALGVSANAWRAWEYGKSSPTVKNALKIAELLGISEKEFFEAFGGK